jgi:hypothetical protein
VSYHMYVYAKRRLDRDQLAALVRDARLGAEPGQQALTIVRDARRQYCFTLGEAAAIEAEDVPDEVTAVALAPQWMYKLLVEGSSAVGTAYAIGFARRLAETAEGVVLDQQTGQTWARGELRAVVPVARGHADVVKLIWYTRDVDEPQDLAEQWLGLARRFLPEALPRRFGPVEPPAGRLDRDGDAAFVAAVAAEPMLLFFKATAPCIEGHLSGRSSRKPTRGHALLVHREALRQAEWREALHRLFVEFARGSRAFFASAEVIRNLVWHGRSIGYGASTERTTYLAPRGRWYGLPPYPVWWSWFGADYRPLVVPHLPPAHVTEIAQGVLYEAATAPADRDELQQSSWLPADLLARPDDSDPRRFNPPLAPAHTLPGKPVPQDG